jgi:hypothetical protein
MSASLFKPFRALGYITDNVPFAVSRRGKETYVVVSVGKTWQVSCLRIEPPHEPPPLFCALASLLMLLSLLPDLQLQQAHAGNGGAPGVYGVLRHFLASLLAS